jgi:hypothetical protein
MVNMKTLLKGSSIALVAMMLLASFVIEGCGSAAQAPADPNYQQPMAPKTPAGKTPNSISKSGKGPEPAGD